MQSHSRVLIVDDNPTNVAILEELLGDTYHLATATSGEECLEMAPHFQPALVLLDVMMPGIDGYEVCRRLRANPLLCYTKIIMVSARAMVSDRLQGYAAGADDYVTKPFDAEELLAKVRVYLRLKSIEEVDRLKTDVLALLSHETRTPLNGIIAPVQMLMAEQPMAAEEQQMWLTMIYQSTRRLQGLFEKIMTLSHMKTGQWDFLFVSTDLAELVRAVVEGVGTAAAACHVDIAQELCRPALVPVDLAQMKFVITVILENAVRFSPPGACVTVRLVRHDDHFCLRVVDQGVGIEPHLLPYVGDALVSADVTHHTAGQGLSLAIAHQIVLAHGGTIRLESIKDVGTTVTVCLPICEATVGSDGPATWPRACLKT